MAYEFQVGRYLMTDPPVSAMPLTMALWFRMPSVNASVARILCNIGNSNPNNGTNGGYRLVLPTNTSVVRALQVVHGVFSNFADTPSGAYQANQWAHCASVFASTTSRTAYSSLSGSATSTTAVNPPVVNNFGIAAGSGPGLNANVAGELAEVGVWSAALTADEIASLADGMTCDKVRPQSLVFYAPLVRDLIDVRGGLTITNNNGATVSSHPRIYY